MVVLHKVLNQRTMQAVTGNIDKDAKPDQDIGFDGNQVNSLVFQTWSLSDKCPVHC